MCSFNEQFDRNVFATFDQGFDLSPVVGESLWNADRECFDTLDSRSPVRESIVSCKVVLVELGHSIDLPFNPVYMAGFSDDVGI